MLVKAEEGKPQKGREKKRSHPGGDGDGGARRKRRGGGEEGERGQTDSGRKRLDALSVGYFRRVGERLGEGFENDEEKEMFVENVLTEVRGKASLVATDRTGSITLQQLLPLSHPEQVAQVLAELGGESGSEFQVVSCDPCGGHVVESAVRQMSKSTVQNPPEEESCGVLEAQVLSLSQMVRDNSEQFIRHVHGSHVVRTLLHVLAGCLGPPRTESRPGAKERKVVPQLTDFEIPTSFWYELKSLTETLMDNVNCDAVFQTMLTVCHRKRPKLCKQLLRRTMEYLSSRSAAPGVSPLLVFLKDQASSRLIETITQLAHKAVLRDLYKNHLRGQLVDLALHPIANFPIQRMTAASAKHKLVGRHFLRLFDELIQGLEAILAAGHMGVIVQLAESCAESGEKQAELMQSLLNAFHCAEPGSRHVSCLPLFMSLLTYEVYYHSDTAEGGTKTEIPLSSICYHGSRLVQALARFNERSLLLSSLRTLTPADLLTLATDPAGSHVLQALITTSSDKGRGKILKRLEYVQMSCSRLGSRVLEAVWNSASVNHRQSIAQELVGSESQLRSDQFARHVWAKFALSHFIHRRAHWQEIQTGESKKRKLFSDILD
uniref:NOP9 nucleolar protein n=1 Tax=Mola mola TaxID=94237 RepID=A0A3Q4BCZ7_MOLML